MAYYTPSTVTNITGTTGSVVYGDGHVPVGYHVQFVVERDEAIMNMAQATAEGLRTFNRIEFDLAGWFGPKFVMVSVLVSGRQDVEWLILKYPNAAYKEVWVA